MNAPVRHSAQRVMLCLAAAVAFASCRTATRVVTEVVQPAAPPPAPTVESIWTSMQTSIFALLADNRVPAADSSLLQFSRDHARTPEAARARWWRTLLRVDTRAAGAEPSMAIMQIDSLLADSISIDIRTEALMMRRSINAIDSLRRVELRRRVQAMQLANERLDELKSARDSVTKLAAEVDRLRRRLRAP